MERYIPYLLLKMVFLAFKTLLSPLGAGKKTFLSTLNVMILQTVRNECVRFGGHVDIEVSYKILRLDVLKETQNLHNLSCFE
jgi:ABC-type phosphate transport system ATPase subunit